MTNLRKAFRARGLQPDLLLDIIRFGLLDVVTVITQDFAEPFHEACKRRNLPDDESILNEGVFCKIFFTHLLISTYSDLSATDYFDDREKCHANSDRDPEYLHLKHCCSRQQYFALIEVLEKQERAEDKDFDGVGCQNAVVQELVEKAGSAFASLLKGKQNGRVFWHLL